VPQKIVCVECGEVLYDSKELKPPMEIIQQLEATCPQCGKHLVFQPENVEITTE
jgi:DNA-directed RNA polymerase subunit RPC12/RpoP